MPPRESEQASGIFEGGVYVSIVRVGLAETKNFADGYEAIFGKKKSGGSQKTKAVAKTASARKKKKPKKK